MATNNSTQVSNPGPSLHAAIESIVAEHAKLSAPSARDPGGFLNFTAVTTNALRACETLQSEAVQQARRADHSWAELGSLLGISRQAVQQRFAPELTVAGQPESTKRITWANANSEMHILKTVGMSGYHLVRLGGVWMEVEPSASAWEHRREVSAEMAQSQGELEAEGWEYVGRWFPFHYFKRKLNRKPGSPMPAKAKMELFPKEWIASFNGHSIRVRNTWNTGIKLFVDDTLWAENDAMVAVDKHAPILRAQVETDTGESFVVEVFAYAILTTKVKIAVNGEQIAGDAF